MVKSSCKVPAHPNPLYSSIAPGKDTNDKIFLLSITEAQDHFSSDSARQASATQYAVAQGAKILNQSYTDWWLRAQANDTSTPKVAIINGNYGSTYEVGREIWSKQAVRPAFWIKL